ncbi:protein neprosin-like [Musa acuminata AAA Group]|uniref:protein neprosin-like n=1 Tax=Musa acuminata AAA Group TaxID=214697 RepID=UPI0031D808D9
MLEKIITKEAEVMVEDVAEAMDMAETLKGLKYNAMFAKGDAGETQRPQGKSMAGGITELWRASRETCPQGTVPIRRTTEEEALRVRKYERKLLEGAAESPFPNHEVRMYAIGTVKDENLYYGAEATYNVWAPAVANNGEFSLSQFWLTSGTYATNLNTIEAGWQADAYKSTGCYNIECAGFVQTDTNIVLGGSINPSSTYNGKQMEVEILVRKVFVNMSAPLSSV